MVRPADPLDGATPSGASSIAEALLTAAHLVPAPRSDRYATAAAEALSAATPVLARLPRSGGNWLAVAEAAVRGPIQIAVATDDSDSPLLDRRPHAGAGRGGGGRRRGELLGAADRPRPGRRRRRRLRVPRPGVRPAGHHHQGPRCGVESLPCSVRRMSTPEDNAKTVNRYLELLAKGQRGRRSPSCTQTTRTVEDPVGGEVHIGREAIRGLLLERSRAANNETEMFTLRALGHEAAFFWGAHRRPRRQPADAHRASSAS